MSIIIIRPYKLIMANRTSKPYIVESSEDVALLGLTQLATMQPIPNDSGYVGAQVDVVTLDIRADDSGNIEYNEEDGINTSGGMDAASYTISAAYGAINGGKDTINTSGGIGSVSLTVTAGYVTYSREADAINTFGGIAAITIS